MSNGNMVKVNIGAATVTLKRVEAEKSGAVTLVAVKGGKRIGGQRIPVSALSSLAGTVVKCNGESVKLAMLTERPDNARGRKVDDEGNPIPFLPRTTGTLEVTIGDESFGITVEAKAEKNAETAMLTVKGAKRSEGTGGGGRKAAPVVDLADALAFLSE